MAGKRKTLSPTQAALLNRVVEQRKQYVAGKDMIEERHRIAIEQELEALEDSYALAIRAAFDSGIPIAHIGQVGMNTTDWNTPKRWLEKTDKLAAAMAGGSDLFTWEGNDVIVRYPGFPTSATASDYPEILEGRLARDRQSKIGWAVLEDPLTQHTDLGDLPGFITWELESVPASKPNSLVSMLNEWAGVE